MSNKNTGPIPLTIKDVPERLTVLGEDDGIISFSVDHYFPLALEPVNGVCYDTIEDMTARVVATYKFAPRYRRYLLFSTEVKVGYE